LARQRRPQLRNHHYRDPAVALEARRRGLRRRAIKVRKIQFNPGYAAELETETRDAPLAWEPDQVGIFLDHVANDRR
jgi:hypothetical protein